MCCQVTSELCQPNEWVTSQMACPWKPCSALANPRLWLPLCSQSISHLVFPLSCCLQLSPALFFLPVSLLFLWYAKSKTVLFSSFFFTSKESSGLIWSADALIHVACCGHKTDSGNVPLKDEVKAAQAPPFLFLGLCKPCLRNCIFSHPSWPPPQLVFRGEKSRKQSINPHGPWRSLEQWPFLPPRSLHKYLTLVCKTN